MQINHAAQLLVYGIGNHDRGDDAQGPLLIDWLDEKPAEGWQLTLEHPYQLQPENLYEFTDKQAIMFIDADVRLREGIAFQPIKPLASQSAFISHAVSPEHLLDLYQRTMHQSAPPAWLLSLSAQGMELGEGISAAATENLQQAKVLLTRLLTSSIDEWQQWQRSAALAGF